MGQQETRNYLLVFCIPQSLNRKTHHSVNTIGIPNPNVVILLDKMTERILQSIPLWATLFMISVMVYLDLALLNRPHFLISAVPILIFVLLAVIIALVRHYRYSKEGQAK